MSQVAHLYQLQQIDDELRQGRARLQQIQRQLSDQTELHSARREANEAEAALANWRRQQQALSEARQGFTHKLTTSEQRLYSGNVKNPKELNDLQLSIESLGRQRASIEDDLLEAMVMVDDLEAQALGAAERLANLEVEWEEIEAGLQAEKATLESSQVEHRQARESTVAHISGGLLKEYDRLTKRQRNAVAVAGLRGGSCQMCGVGVPSHLARAAEQGELAHCESCGRILFPV